MPLTYDMFGPNNFRAIDYQEDIIEEIEFAPTFMSELGIFEERNLLTRDIALAKKGNTLALIPTSPDGAPPQEYEPDAKNLRPFRTSRLAKGSTIYAYEVAGFVDMPEERQLLNMTRVVEERSRGVLNDFQLTREHMRFGAVNGYLLDADGSVIYDFWDEWQITKPAALEWPAGDPDANLYEVAREIKRRMIESLQMGGIWPPGARIVMLCASDVFDASVSHPSVKELMVGHAAALRLTEIEGYSTFDIGPIRLVDFQGGFDGTAGSVIAIPDGQARIFPTGIPGAFLEVNGACQEFKEYLGEVGRPVFSLVITDKDRGSWDRIEHYAYPSYIPTRMGGLFEVTLTNAA